VLLSPAVGFFERLRAHEQHDGSVLLPSPYVADGRGGWTEGSIKLGPQVLTDTCLPSELASTAKWATTAPPPDLTDEATLASLLKDTRVMVAHGTDDAVVPVLDCAGFFLNIPRDDSVVVDSGGGDDAAAAGAAGNLFRLVPGGDHRLNRGIAELLAVMGSQFLPHEERAKRNAKADWLAKKKKVVWAADLDIDVGNGK
jgi:hypothetical protein